MVCHAAAWAAPSPDYQRAWAIFSDPAKCDASNCHCSDDYWDCGPAWERASHAYPDKLKLYWECSHHDKVWPPHPECLRWAGFDPSEIALVDDAAEKMNAGQMAAACSGAKAALAQSPKDQRAFGITQLACRDAQPPKADPPKPEKDPLPPPADAPTIGKDTFNSKGPSIGLSLPAAKRAAADRAPSLGDKLRRLAESKADGNYDETIAQADEILKAFPNNKDALNAKAFAQNRKKDYKGALQTADMAIKASTGSAAAYANKAYALGALGDRKGMIEALKLAAELDPQFQAALEKAENSDAAGLFDMPGEVVESKLQGTKAKEGGGLTPELLKWVVVAAIGLPLMGLILFFALKNTLLKTPAPKPATPWPQGTSAAPAKSERLEDKYQLGPQIGAGGMGMVFAGKDLSLNRKVAIKKMLPQLAAQPKLRERFVSEARTVAALHHPNIVDIFAIVEENQDLYLIFEYVEGKTLADLIFARGKLNFQEAANIVRDIALALDFAHGQGIIHRDLKPSNVMMDGAGRVVVMDFGLARTVQDLMSQAAVTNTVVGTPAYMAPEQENGVVCKQSDVYSLGICLYEMLSGKRPFDGSPAAMLASKTAMKYDPISKLAGGLPAGLDIFFTCALTADPKKRPATPKEFVAALDALTPVPAG